MELAVSSVLLILLSFFPLSFPFLFFSLIKVIYIIIFILLSEKTVAFSDRINGMRKETKVRRAKTKF